jgi:hypothetical protein
MYWSNLLASDSKFDRSFRLFVGTVLFLWVLFMGSSFETPYYKKMVELYAEPWWRALLVIALFIALIWCPRVGILLAVAAFFYLHDIGAIAETENSE